jgi:hypothetical protein
VRTQATTPAKWGAAHNDQKDWNIAKVTESSPPIAVASDSETRPNSITRLGNTGMNMPNATAFITMVISTNVMAGGTGAAFDNDGPLF